MGVTRPLERYRTERAMMVDQSSLTVKFCQEYYRICDHDRLRAVSHTRAQSGEEFEGETYRRSLAGKTIKGQRRWMHRIPPQHPIDITHRD